MCAHLFSSFHIICICQSLTAPNIISYKSELSSLVLIFVCTLPFWYLQQSVVRLTLLTECHRSDHAETSCILYRCLETLFQDFLRTVLWNQQLVETSMGAWQSLIIFSILNDIELEGLKAGNGCSVTACAEGQPFSSLLIAPLFQNYLP